MRARQNLASSWVFQGKRQIIVCYCCRGFRLQSCLTLRYSNRKVEELIKVEQAFARRLGVIKRFTGGGTVVVDANTIFTTLIMQVRRL